MLRPNVLLPLAALALSACGPEAAAPDPGKNLDPAVVAALADPIMIDPDLASQNRGNAAIALTRFDGVPSDDRSPEAVEAARAEAAQLAGGVLEAAPKPTEPGKPAPQLMTAGQVAAALTRLPPGCIAGLRYGYAWAAQFPAALPIYPRGHVQEAAGSASCALRAAVFSTPVDAGGVIDFYYTRAKAAGYTLRRSSFGEVEALAGSKGGSVYLVRVRQADGLSQVELAVRG